VPDIPRPAIPRRALTRGAKLAALPVSYAGRTAWGVGKRIGGRLGVVDFGAVGRLPDGILADLARCSCVSCRSIVPMRS